MDFTDIAEVVTEPGRALVYEHGWQSWSPAGLCPAAATSPRPPNAERQTMGYRPDKPAPASGFQGEGLLAIVPAEGPVRFWASAVPAAEVASIRLRALADRLVVAANGPVVERVHEGALTAALGAWADEAGAGALRPIPPGWCTWYGYWGDVTEADVLANVEAIDRLGLDVGIVQVDDGHQAEPGDWLERSPRFGPLDLLADRIRATGRWAGIWTAPFVVGARSRIALEHADWLVGGADAGRNWGQQLGVLDVAHPDAAEHLLGVFRTLAGQGFGYHKLDFLYAGALPGRRHGGASAIDAYREGLRLVRAGAGPDAILVGCGAPLLPSIGLVDAMRIGPDVDPRWEPLGGDLTWPSGRGALAAGRARAWMHGRLWVNDPDCLIVRPEVEQRELWAAHVEACHGVAFSSDRLADLDARGLELTRKALRPASVAPVDWDAFVG